MYILFNNLMLLAFEILKKETWVSIIFLYLLMSLKRQNTIFWSDLSLGSMLGLLVLKKYAECTSRHVKWTSGARVVLFCRERD